MAIITGANFRAGTLAEYCFGLALTQEEVSGASSEALLTAVIARQSQRFDDLCNDRFEQFEDVFTLSGDGTSTLDLPHRTTGIDYVVTIDQNGTDTYQEDSRWVLESSLDPDGARRLGKVDCLYVIPGQSLENVIGWGPMGGLQTGRWPDAAGSIRISGTFGWTVTPGDVKRAVALMVYDHVKAQAAHLRKSLGFQTADAQFQFSTEDPDHPTGINEVDDIIRNYRRDTGILVG